MSLHIVDQAVFDGLKDMMGADFIGELVDTYLEDAPHLIEQMHQGLASGDADVFRRAAHSLKSNSANFGAMQLAGQARQLEMLGKEGRLEGADALVAELEASYLQVKSVLEALRDEAA